MRWVVSVACAVVLLTGCSSSQGGSQAAAQGAPGTTTPGTPAAPPKLGIRPSGDTDIQPDMTRIPADLKQVFDHIDAHIDEHVENLQKWIRQPSISNSGEGIQESAELVKGEQTLRDAKFEKIAIANPVTAPYGAAAVEVSDNTAACTRCRSLG